jgi:hypothetical protein
MPKMCNQGINEVLNYWWAGLLGASAVSPRPSIYIGLYTAPTSEPAATATLSSLTEPSGYGYARIQLNDGDWTVASQIATNLQKTFTASGGNWGNVYGYFICDCASGTSGNLIAVENFSDGPYNVVNGGSVKVTPKFTES